MSAPGKFHPLEVDGRRWLVAVRMGPNGTPESSFDGGETWDENASRSFARAREAGKLIPETPLKGEGPEELVAVTQELLQQLRSLEVGEELRLTRTTEAVLVTKQKVVVAFRHSVLEEAGIERAPEEEPHG